jgi:hypothetical protein
MQKIVIFVSCFSHHKMMKRHLPIFIATVPERKAAPHPERRSKTKFATRVASLRDPSAGFATRVASLRDPSAGFATRVASLRDPSAGLATTFSKAYSYSFPKYLYFL